MISERELKYIAEGRRRARTDLIYLSRHILGFDKINEHVHGPMIEHLQQFDIQGEDRLDPKGLHEYIPPARDPVKILKGSRRRLLLAPRGWYKTTVNVVSHTIQWILNYPDITIQLIHASQEIVEQMMDLIKQKFQNTPTMRYFFPEFCPPVNKKEWGTRQYFNTPARRIFTASPTVSVGGIESTRTGMHYHILKFTDIVDEKNSLTAAQCQKVILRYGLYRNLLISPNYWIDVEGTRYDYSDLYGRIIDEHLKEPKDKKTFQIFLMGCYKKKVEGKEEFSPEEQLDAPYLLDQHGNFISRFPEEFPTDALEAMRKDPVTGEWIFACQQLNDPVAAGVDESPFPLRYLRWKTEEELKKIPIMYYITTVDLAEKQSERSDYTCITTAGWDRYGRCYVVDVRMGKFMPEETVDHLFGVFKKWKPLKIVIEETGFATGLEPTIKRVSEMFNLWPPFEFIKRDTKFSKADRIMSLQPWYKNGLIYFSEDLDEFVKEQVRHQLTRFPRYRHDDLLDTLADQFQKKPYFGPVKPSRTEKEIMAKARELAIYRADRREMIFGPEPRDDSWEGLGAL